MSPATAAVRRSIPPVADEGGTRLERKQRTRRAILDAALELSREETFAALSLRAVAKRVGIVPTAFYRHFESVEALGLALVDESFVSLRAMMRDVRRSGPAFQDIIDGSLRVLVEHVHAQRDHFLFIARERGAGPLVVREAIAHQIELFEHELAMDLARIPGPDGWSSEDLEVLSNLIVTQVVATADQILTAPPDAESAIVARAQRQLRMVLVGAVNWRSRP